MEINRFGYYWLDTWILANVIQLATQDFCTRFLNHNNDPCGRQYDQMTQAARSAPANIAEGNSRHSTSKETEMKLTDVARATLSNLPTITLTGCCVRRAYHGRFIQLNIRLSAISVSTVQIIMMTCNIRAVFIFLPKSISLTNGLRAKIRSPLRTACLCFVIALS